ncbi:hypothetical protein CC79DRAFT_1336743 [Sarocladium strictum]
MNWTEGALARHSRRRGWNPGLARQKEYFAKARAGKKPAADHQSTFVPSYIASATPQRTSSAGVETPILPYHPSTSRGLQDTPDTSSILDGDNNGKAPRSLSSSKTSKASPTAAPHSKIEAKRRRLLQQNDWTGVSLPRPPDINFDHIRHDYLSRKPVGKTGFTKSTPTKHDTHNHGTRLGPNASPYSNAGPASIRMRISDRNLKWSHAGGSIRTSRTVISSSAAQSPAVAGSLPSSPPISRSIISMSSPASRTSRAGSYSRAKHNSTKVWKRRSPRSVTGMSESAPFVPDGPRYVVQSVLPKILHPVPTSHSARGTIRMPSPSDRTVAGSLIVEPEEELSESTSELGADAAWRAFLTGIDRPTSRLSGSEEMDTEELRTHLPVLIEEPPDPNLNTNATIPQSVTDVDLLPPRLNGSVEMNHCQSIDTGTEECRLRRNGYIRQVERPPKLSEQFASETSVGAWKDDPEVRDLLSQRHAPQNMLHLLEKQLEAKDTSVKKARSTPGQVGTDEESLWRKFMFDDNPEEIKQKAERSAMRETTRQIMSERTAIRSDEVEVASPAPAIPSPTSCHDRSSMVCDSLSTGSDGVVLRDGRNSREAMSTVAEHGSPSDKSANAANKLHLPAPFVGRLASITSNDGASRQPTTTTIGQNKRLTRSRKRWRSERPEIRALPDFDEDPIEEDA